MSSFPARWTFPLLALVMVTASILALTVAHLIAATPITPATNAQVKLRDDFSNGATVSNVWTVSTPFSDSSVIQSNRIQLKNRGRILSTISLPQRIIVKSRIQFKNNERSNLKFVLRTAASEAGNGEFFGFHVQFQPRTDWEGYVSQLSMTDMLTSTNVTRPINMNTWYDVLITDDGYTVAAYLNNETIPAIEMSSTNRYGNYFAVYNREGLGGGSSISANGMAELDYVELASVIPTVSVKTAVYFSSDDLNVGEIYNVQYSTNMTNWMDVGIPFSAETPTWRSTNYWDLDDYNKVFFRLVPAQ